MSEIGRLDENVIIIEHNPHDSRTRIARDQKNVQSLAAYMGTGGNNVPLVMIKSQNKSILRETDESICPRKEKG